MSECFATGAPAFYRHWVAKEAFVKATGRGVSSLKSFEVALDAPGGPLFWDDATLTREAKPLIETKFEIRKRMYQHLPDFVARLAKHLDVSQKFQLDDVPF